MAVFSESAVSARSLENEPASRANRSDFTPIGLERAYGHLPEKVTLTRRRPYITAAALTLVGPATAVAGLNEADVVVLRYAVVEVALSPCP
jgi:hypothetical protein